MPIPSNVLASVSPPTFMRVYYCDNSGMVERLPGYAGVTTLESVSVDRRASKFR